ncbi:MAG: hypothetical protein A2070_13910 [Bdellovibrionales bacterium GWC1_52_8]|nr:MAG: hypothetical protein A2Z97_08330 [Bdellovibrionales bacterium GWB1_52_6]OFZ03008.1 MAG: hypothetical protein A2X97_12170 [Bdellovibrionales bacterium GWA1_52_35]OFZ36384.1 MAG: hypothetical protein A2070_13910 [Bdellovibrionales bacterium GWC1_52_8]
MRSQYLCYTDGACKKSKDTPGGWGIHIKVPNGEIIDQYGGAIKTSVSAMELTAIAEALEQLPERASAVIFSDSKSALDYCSVQILIWRRNQWVGCKDPNIKLLQEIDRLLTDKVLKIEWTWIRSHNGNPGNERADELAATGAREALKKVKSSTQSAL